MDNDNRVVCQKVAMLGVGRPIGNQQDGSTCKEANNRKDLPAFGLIDNGLEENEVWMQLVHHGQTFRPAICQKDLVPQSVRPGLELAAKLAAMTNDEGIEFSRHEKASP